MSTDQIKQMNAITNMAFKSVLGLCGFACSMLFYSMWNDIGFLKSSAATTDTRLIRIETQLIDQKEAAQKRDKEIDDAIRELKRKMR